jgi:hypothetical protein
MEQLDLTLINKTKAPIRQLADRGSYLYPPDFSYLSLSL